MAKIGEIDHGALGKLEELVGQPVRRKGPVRNEFTVGFLEGIDHEAGIIELREGGRTREMRGFSDRGIRSLNPAIAHAVDEGEKVVHTGSKIRRGTMGPVTEAPVLFDLEEQQRAKKFHRDERSSRAREVDFQKLAKNRTTDYETWASNPRRWDYPGVDTPPYGSSHREKYE